MRRFRVFAAPAVVGAVLVAFPAAAATHLVPDDYATIQEAVDAAEYGDEVVVGPGVYRDAQVRETAFGWVTYSVVFLKNGVVLRSSAGPLETVIDGEGVRHGIVGDGLDAQTVVEGFTIRNCIAAGEENWTRTWGGGMLVFDSAVKIRGNVFFECYAVGGGGLFIHQSLGVDVFHNLFWRCSAGQLGGGVEGYDSRSCNLIWNTFAECSSAQTGGGVLMNEVQGAIVRNIFWRNTAGNSAPAHGCMGGSRVGGRCNVYWENESPDSESRNTCGFGPGDNDNIAADPLFCDPAAGDFTLRLGSPASADQQPDCGWIGAYEVGCGPVSTEERSWGRIKAGYRRPAGSR